MYIYVSTQKNIQKHIHETDDGEFPGGPVDRIQRFHCRGLGSIPGQRTETPQAKKNPPKTKQTEKETDDNSYIYGEKRRNDNQSNGQRN